MKSGARKINAMDHDVRYIPGMLGPLILQGPLEELS